MSDRPQKLYAYVDENGGETRGRIFVVSVIHFEGDPVEISGLCEQWELNTKKRSKWGHTKHSARMDYIRHVLAHQPLRGRLCYAVFRNTNDYDTATIQAIARAIHTTNSPHKANIYVDALSKKKRNEYGARLRKLGLKGHKVQGIVSDENSPLIRLADALAGFVRDALDGNSSEISSLFNQAKSDGIIVEV